VEKGKNKGFLRSREFCYCWWDCVRRECFCVLFFEFLHTESRL